MLVAVTTECLENGLRPVDIARELTMPITTLYSRLQRAGYKLEKQPMKLVAIHPQGKTNA
jgi:DNA-directed RNA polymerase specialized sigma24 family protein